MSQMRKTGGMICISRTCADHQILCVEIITPQQRDGVHVELIFPDRYSTASLVNRLK